MIDKTDAAILLVKCVVSIALLVGLWFLVDPIPVVEWAWDAAWGEQQGHRPPGYYLPLVVVVGWARWIWEALKIFGPCFLVVAVLGGIVSLFGVHLDER